MTGGLIDDEQGERTEYKNYRGISLLSVFGKIYVRILVDGVGRVTGGLIDDEQVDFRAGRGMFRSDLHHKADR